MVYYKTINDDGFVSLSTVNADGEGNITKSEYEQILQMIKDAPEGQGVVEDGSGYAYAEFPVIESDVPPEEVLEALEEIL